MNVGDREVIIIQVGQAGIQMGEAIWELLCVEHQISSNGRRNGVDLGQNENVHTFFRTTESGYYVPRGLFLDLEPSVVDEIRTSKYRELFHPDCFINAYDDAASNFARAYYTTGSCVMSTYAHQLRRMVEACDSLQAFIIVHSAGGGTGAGLCAKVSEHLSTTLGKMCKIDMPITPSPILTSAVVEPYNCILSSHFSMEHNDLSIMMDNEAMYQICMRFMNMNSPTFHNLNRMIAQMVSTITSNIRFSGTLPADVTQLGTNLVPYPRIHFLLSSFAPVLSYNRSMHESLSVQQITNLAFDPNCQMVKLETDMGKFMSVALLYRGDVTPRDCCDAITMIKRHGVRFVDWCPTGFKISINSQPSCVIPDSQMAPSPRFVSMIANNTAAAQSFMRIISKFQALYQKRAFVHWYVGEGLEEGEFMEGVENVRAMAQDYQACGMDTVFSSDAKSATPSIDEGGREGSATPDVDADVDAEGDPDVDVEETQTREEEADEDVEEAWTME